MTEGSQPALLLGTGVEAFTPVLDGDTLLLARGCQGSQHVWIALRTTGAISSRLFVQLSFVRVRDDFLGSWPFRARIQFEPSSDETGLQVSGLALVVPVPEDLLGEQVSLHGSASDDANTTVVSERRVWIEWGDEICGSF